MWRTSMTSPAFEDRRQAGRRLAQRLEHYRDDQPVVLALPRGGVAIGYEIARALNAPLDVIVARKVGVPGHRELGMGAIAPGGVRVIDEATVRMLGITQAQIDRVVQEEAAEMERRLRMFRGNRAAPDLHDKTAIIVDDGLATGVTARAAIEWTHRQQPRRTVLAVPVSAPETVAALKLEVDDLVCVEMPVNFVAVGFWYEDFDQTTDREVIDLLERAGREYQSDVDGNAQHSA
jgi:predicted phosphoribosyltransferase